MASAIGDGLLGFIAGAADAGARIEGRKIESDIALERQLSLLQVQRNLAEQDNQDLLDSLKNNVSPEELERLGGEGSIELLLSEPGREIVESRVEARKTAAEREREQRNLEAASEGLRGLGLELSPEQVGGLSEAGVDIDNLIPEPTDAPTEEEIQGIMSSANVDRSTAIAFIRNPSLGSSILSARGRQGSVPKTISIRDKTTGEIREVTQQQGIELLARTNEDGTAQFESGERKVIDDEVFFITNTSVTPVGSADDPPPNLSPREQFELRVEATTQQESFRKQDLDGVNPSELGLDLIDASGGPINSIRQSLGGLGIGSELGRAEVQASNALRDIRSQVQAALNIGSKPLSAILENVFNQIPVPSGLGALRPGSDKFTRASLEQARRSVRRTIDSAKSVQSDKDIPESDRGEAREVEVRMTKVLGSLNTLIADDDISKLKVPVINPQTGRRTTENLTSLDSTQQLRAIDLNSLSERQKNLVTLWGMKLRFDRGFNTNG